MIVTTIGILLPSISDDLNLSPSQQGVLVASAFWCTPFLAIPIGSWTSKFHPKPLTSWTLIAGSICLIIQGLSRSFYALLFSRLAFGLTLIAREPARPLLIRQWFPQNEIVLANSMGSLLFGGIVGSGLALVPIILRATHNEWRPVYLIFFATTLVLTLCWVIFGKEKSSTVPDPEHSTSLKGIISGALSYRDLWIGGLGFTGSTIARSAFGSFLPTLMLNTKMISLQWAGSALGLSTVLGGLSGLVAGYVVMKTGGSKRFFLIFGIILTVTYLGMVNTDSEFLLLFLATINGIAWGFWPLLQTIPFQLPRITPRELAVASAFNQMAISIGIAIGPLAVGFLQQATGDLQFSLSILSFTPASLVLVGIFLNADKNTAK
jgi:predicted MFS family arabinose efflux permease